ncbi:MAG: alpha/beta hydrolase domain-containing protein, partial [candidate division NC10 bacterium]
IGGAEQLLIFAGSTIPFPRTRREREAAGDPRPSIEERYRSREDYLARVRQATVALAKEGYILRDDVELSVTFAARMWDHWAGP